MKYYKDFSNPPVVYAYEADGSQDDFIKPGLIEMTTEEIEAHLNPPVPPPSKDELLSSIKVTTASGKTFDGNETARNNLLCALTVASYTGQISTNWKLADNTTQSVTLDELKEALALSLTQVGKIVGAIA